MQVNKAFHTCTSWYAYAAMFSSSRYTDPQSGMGERGRGGPWVQKGMAKVPSSPPASGWCVLAIVRYVCLSCSLVMERWAPKMANGSLFIPLCMRRTLQFDPWWSYPQGESATTRTSPAEPHQRGLLAVPRALPVVMAGEAAGGVKTGLCLSGTISPV